MLRTPELKPFIVYVKAPSFERLRDTRTTAYARSTFVENGNRAFTVRSLMAVHDRGTIFVKEFNVTRSITYLIDSKDARNG